MGNAIQISLIGKPGCHLCDDARAALNETLAAFSGDHSDVEIAVTEFNILDDAAIAENTPMTFPWFW